MVDVVFKAGPKLSILPPSTSKPIMVIVLELHVGTPHGGLVCYRQLFLGCRDVGVCTDDVLDITFILSYVNLNQSLASSFVNSVDSCVGVSLCEPINHLERPCNASLETQDPCGDVADQETIRYNVCDMPIEVHASNEDTTSEPQPSLTNSLREHVVHLTSRHIVSAPQTYSTYSPTENGTEVCSLSNQAYGYVQLEKHPIWIEISEDLKALVEHVKMGLNAGQSPKLASEGSGGVYFMKDVCGMHNVAVFKPMDEEPMAVNNPRGFSSYAGGEGLKKGTRSGEGAIREVAAYILDHSATTVCGYAGIEKEKEGFAGVPLCAMVTCYHDAFTYKCGHKEAKLGSLQRFVPSFATCEEMGVSFFPVEEVHKITVLDLRLANTDRHAGNILVCRDKHGGLKLVPIDHGYCLPETFEDCTFEWLYWPQASQPYGPSTLKYIEALDAEQDIELLQQCGWKLRPACARVLRIATMLLKKGAAAGLTPFQIGSIMSSSKSTDKQPPIEALIKQAEALGCPCKTELVFLKAFANILDEYIARCIGEKSV